MTEEQAPASLQKSWQCQGCGEQNPPAFEACWNCGTTLQGEVDPGFRRAEEIDPHNIPARDPEEQVLPYPPLKKQFSLAFLLGVVTLSAILAAMLRTRVGWGIFAILAVAILVALVLIGIQTVLLFVFIYGGGMMKDLLHSSSKSEARDAISDDDE